MVDYAALIHPTPLSSRTSEPKRALIRDPRVSNALIATPRLLFEEERQIRFTTTNTGGYGFLLSQERHAPWTSSAKGFAFARTSTCRHHRACPGDPGPGFINARKTWMAGPSARSKASSPCPAMTEMMASSQDGLDEAVIQRSALQIEPELRAVAK